MHPRIYIVDNDIGITTLIGNALQSYGLDSTSFHTGSAFKRAIKAHTPDICIIDPLLPDQDGLQLIRELTQEIECGFIIISAREALPDRVLGLELGADDYLCKPFEPRELVARIHSLLRRIDKSPPSITIPLSTNESRASFANCVFEKHTLAVCNVEGRTIQLSSEEAKILTRFLKSPNCILTRDQLRSRADDSFDRCIDVRISRLRKKLEPNPKQPHLIKTVYGAGYLFSADVQWH